MVYLYMCSNKIAQKSRWSRAVTDVKLTKKQKDFADSYIETGNGRQSALKAYDCGENTAGVIAHENLKKDNVQEYLKQQALAIKKTVNEKLVESGAMDKAITSALQDIESSDRLAKKDAREFILKLHQFAQDSDIKKQTTNNKQINNYLYPKK